MENKGFIIRLEQLLKDNCITQKTLAENIGIRVPTISDWKKNGTFPPVDIALKIAQALNVSVEYLVLGKEENIYKTKYDTLVKNLTNLVSDL